MPLPMDTRKKPVDVKIHLSSGAGVDITWSDGHTSHYEFVYLRDQCPCAMCEDERRKKSPSASLGGGATAALPMFKPKPKARSAHAVGHYAIQIEFTDSHTTGIYSFDYLRTICPCEACTREFRSGTE